MSHELDLTTGEAAIAYVGDTPWHRLGHRLLTPPRTSEEGLQAARINFDVRKVPLYYKERYHPDYFTKADGAYGIIRQDTGVCIATVGEEYEPVQNRELMAIMDPLLQSGVATFESMGALRKGREFWGLVRWSGLPQEVIDRLGAADSQIRTYGVLFGSHDGKSGLVLKNTDIRAVCRNTVGLILNEDGGIRLQHRANVLQHLTEAADNLWGRLVKQYLVAAKRAERLRAFRPMTWAQFETLVLDEVAPNPQKLLTEGATGRIIWNANHRRALVADFWEAGAGHSGDHSAWEAYNGAIQALDHGVTTFRSRDRLASMLNGQIANTKRRILTNLDQLVAA